MQLGTHVPNAHAHVSKAPDIRAIMGLHDVWVGSTVNTYKACRQTNTLQWQHYRPVTWHRYNAK
jgi:hypothetical protein